MPRAVVVAVLGLLVASIATAQTPLAPGTYTLPPGATVVVPPAQETPPTPDPTPPPPPPPPAAMTRCDELRPVLGDAMVYCNPFEQDADAYLRDAGNLSTPWVTIDRTVFASGTGSLRHEVISTAEAKKRNPTMTDAQALALAGASGNQTWKRNFSADLKTQFGLGQPFYVQYRVKHNAGYFKPWGGGGSKLSNIGVGDRWIDYTSTLAQPLPSTAGQGARIFLTGGDAVATMPLNGILQIGTERVNYYGRDLTQNAVIIHSRGWDKTPVQTHAAGAATFLHHLELSVHCSSLETVITAPLTSHVIQSYSSCGLKDGAYEGHRYPYSAYDFIYQSGRPGKWNEAQKTWDGCLYSKVSKGDYSGCLRWQPNQEWVTVTAYIEPGSAWYKNDKQYTHAATLKIWFNKDLLTDHSPLNRHPRVAGALTPEQCAAQPVSLPNASYCLSGYDFYRNPLTKSLTDAGELFGSIQLLVLSWGRNDAAGVDPLICCHDTVMRWYDDLVVSRAPIPLSDGTVLR